MNGFNRVTTIVLISGAGLISGCANSGEFMAGMKDGIDQYARQRSAAGSVKATNYLNQQQKNDALMNALQGSNP